VDTWNRPVTGFRCRPVPIAVAGESATGWRHHSRSRSSPPPTSTS
jgi:hypothetical protein